MRTLDDRLHRFVAGWEPSLEREFLEYDRLLRAKSHPGPCAWGQTRVEPYWKQLPRWLAGRKGNGPREVSPEFLDTVLWGQTALFYAVRLQDDFLDGGLPRSSLLLAPLLFLTEANRAYSSIIDRNTGFWKHYRRAVDTTVTGIVRVAEMQRDPLVPADKLLQAYGSVDAIFSVGSLAVCERLTIPDRIPCVDEFVSEMGKVLLTLDDLEDIEEDLADGRVNYPARILLARSAVVGADLPLLARSWRRHMHVERFDEITTTLLCCLRGASLAIGPLGLQPARDLIETARTAVLSLRDAP